MSEDLDTFTAVFRRGTVVTDRIIYAANFAKAAKKAERMTEVGEEFAGWSVYSLTRGVTA